MEKSERQPDPSQCSWYEVGKEYSTIYCCGARHEEKRHELTEEPNTVKLPSGEISEPFHRYDVVGELEIDQKQKCWRSRIKPSQELQEHRKKDHVGKSLFRTGSWAKSSMITKIPKDCPFYPGRKKD